MDKLCVPLILQQLAAGPARRRAGQLRFGFVAVLVGLILYPLSKFLPALSQFLNNKKPDLVALQHTSPRLFTGSN
jgi:hypothetical protein